MRRGGLTANVDFLHRLVLGLQLHLDGGPEVHVFALQAVEAAGPRQPLIIWKAGRDARSRGRRERTEAQPRAPRSGQPKDAREGGTAPTERQESPRNNPPHAPPHSAPSVTRTIPCVPAIPPAVRWEAGDGRGGPGRPPWRLQSLTYCGLFRRRGRGGEGQLRAGAGDHFGEVGVATPRAELSEIHLEDASALVLLCRGGDESGWGGPNRAELAGWSPRPPPEGSRDQKTPHPAPRPLLPGICAQLRVPTLACAGLLASRRPGAPP